MKSLVAITLAAAFAFSSALCAEGIPFTTKNVMKNTSQAMVKVADDNGHKVKLATTEEVDALLESSPDEVGIIALNKGCTELTIKGATCFDKPPYKTIAQYIEKNPKKNYIIMCNTGKQSLIYTSMFNLSGVDLPNILPVSWKDYQKDGGKFVELR